MVINHLRLCFARQVLLESPFCNFFDEVDHLLQVPFKDKFISHTLKLFLLFKPFHGHYQHDLKLKKGTNFANLTKQKFRTNLHHINILNQKPFKRILNYCKTTSKFISRVLCLVLVTYNLIYGTRE